MEITNVKHMYVTDWWLCSWLCPMRIEHQIIISWISRHNSWTIKDEKVWTSTRDWMFMVCRQSQTLSGDSFFSLMSTEWRISVPTRNFNFFSCFEEISVLMIIGTISRWSKEMLRMAGINNYTAHSSRAVSHSATKSKGISISWDILRAGNGCRECTFNRFYNKTIMSGVENTAYTQMLFSRNKWLTYYKCWTIHCHICSLITKWTWRSHKHLKDMMWDQNSTSYKANIWQCISHPWEFNTNWSASLKYYPSQL